MAFPETSVMTGLCVLVCMMWRFTAMVLIVGNGWYIIYFPFGIEVLLFIIVYMYMHLAVLIIIIDAFMLHNFNIVFGKGVDTSN